MTQIEVRIHITIFPAGTHLYKTSSVYNAIAEPTRQSSPIMSYQRQAVYADKAPKPNGNYSHVVRQGDTLHIAGWMGDDPETGNIVDGGIEAQTVSFPIVPSP